MEDNAVARAVVLLRQRGALFAYLFGSRAVGEERAESDTDVAAFFGSPDADPIALGRNLPPGVDLLILDSAPLELAGRVATKGVLLFRNLLVHQYAVIDDRRVIALLARLEDLESFVAAVAALAEAG